MDATDFPDDLAAWTQEIKSTRALDCVDKVPPRPLTDALWHTHLFHPKVRGPLAEFMGLRDRIAAIPTGQLPLVQGQPRLGVPLTGIGKIIAIGFNYVNHAAEMQVELPTEPLIFMKATSALTGPFDEVIQPRGGNKLDYEVELAVVIGRRAQYVSEADALAYVAGYAVGHDVSERAFQRERGGQFTKGKSADTFAPLGPWLVTRDSIGQLCNGDIAQVVDTMSGSNVGTCVMGDFVPYVWPGA